MSRFPLVLRLLVSATLMVVSTPATAQYIEQIDVSIANVDVVVTDRDGKPVRGITKDDFTLYENGNVQPITNFTAFDQTRTKAVDAPAPSPSAEPPAAAPDRARLVVLFIDIDEIEPVPRKRFFEGVGHYLETAMRPGDFLTLLHWSNRVRVVLPPTSNQKVVAEAVKVLAESNRWSEADIMRRTADAIVEASRLDAAFAGSLGQTGPDPDAESRFQEWFTAEERCARI